MSRHIKVLSEVISTFRDTNPDITGNAVQAFCFIALAGVDGITMQTLEKKMGLSQSAVSRNVAVLHETTYSREPGMGLIVRYEDPMNRRTKIVKLSPKGVRFADRIKQIME